MKTSSLIIIAAMVLMSDQAFALRATTVGNSIACFSQAALEEMVQFVSSGDRDNFSTYIATNRCVILKGGIDVTVIDSPGMFGGTCSFIVKGVKLWTTRQGLSGYRVDDSEKKAQNPALRNESRIPTAEEQAAEWQKAQEIFNRRKPK